MTVGGILRDKGNLAPTVARGATIGGRPTGMEGSFDKASKVED